MCNSGCVPKSLVKELEDIRTLFLSHASYHVLCVQAVKKARDEGWSWAHIGIAMGYTRQGAQQWFATNCGVLDES